MTFLGFSRHDIRLTLNLTRLTLQDKYLATMLGKFWAIIQPLLLLGMYTFIFGFVFKAKAPGSDTTLSYAIWLISGFVPYMAVSEAFSTSASSIIGGAAMIKNIAFKLECLVLAAVLSAFVPFVVGFVFLFCLQAFEGIYPSYTILALPVLIVLQIFFLFSLGLLLSATTVFIRDILHVIPSFLMFWMFFTPIFYSIDMLPRIARRATFFNPLFHITNSYRRIILENLWPDWRGVLYLFVISLLLFLLGLTYFRRLKGFFDSAL